jgi:hypothetical protein
MSPAFAFGRKIRLRKAVFAQQEKALGRRPECAGE